MHHQTCTGIHLLTANYFPRIQKAGGVGWGFSTCGISPLRAQNSGSAAEDGFLGCRGRALDLPGAAPGEDPPNHPPVCRLRQHKPLSQTCSQSVSHFSTSVNYTISDIITEMMYKTLLTKWGGGEFFKVQVPDSLFVIILQA